MLSKTFGHGPVQGHVSPVDLLGEKRDVTIWRREDDSVSLECPEIGGRCERGPDSVVRNGGVAGPVRPLDLSYSGIFHAERFLFVGGHHLLQAHYLEMDVLGRAPDAQVGPL